MASGTERQKAPGHLLLAVVKDGLTIIDHDYPAYQPSFISLLSIIDHHY